MLSKIPSYVWIIGVICVGIIFLVGLIISTQDIPTKQEQELIELAKKVGLDPDQFTKDLRSDEVKNKVENQINEGSQKFEGFSRYTPLVVIDGEVVRLTQIEEIEEILKTKAAQQNEVKLEVYSDFTCPACKQLFEFMASLEQREPTLFEKVKYEKLNLPIVGGNAARKYALAFEAAKLQNKGNEYAKELYNIARK